MNLFIKSKAQNYGEIYFTVDTSSFTVEKVKQRGLVLFQK